MSAADRTRRNRRRSLLLREPIEGLLLRIFEDRILSTREKEHSLIDDFLNAVHPDDRPHFHVRIIVLGASLLPAGA